MALIGFLILTDDFALGKTIQFRNRARHGCTEYNKGQEIPVNDYDDRRLFNILISEDIVQVLDQNRKETTWDKIEKLFPSPYIYPKQRPLIVNKIKANTRPIKKL